MAIMGRPPKSIDVERLVIGDHPHVIIAAPDHRLAAKSRIPLRSLINDTFLLREPGSGTRILTDQIFAKADLAPRFGMEFGSNETIKQAVMAGLGVAFISAHTVAAEVLEGRTDRIARAGAARGAQVVPAAREGQEPSAGRHRIVGLLGRAWGRVPARRFGARRPRAAVAAPQALICRSSALPVTAPEIGGMCNKRGQKKTGDPAIDVPSRAARKASSRNTPGSMSAKTSISGSPRPVDARRTERAAISSTMNTKMRSTILTVGDQLRHGVSSQTGR